MIVWLPKGTEPDDAGSWRDIVAHALGGLRPRRVELQRYGAKWRVRIAVQFDGAGAVPLVAGCAWADVTDEVAAALLSAGKPVFT